MMEGPRSNGIVQAEVMSKNDRYRVKKDNEVINLEIENNITWEHIKNTTLSIGGRAIANPYLSRIYYPRGELHEWIKKFRELCKPLIHSSVK